MLIQLAFYIFFIKCLFKNKIFRHKFISYINLIFETSLLTYFVICTGEGWCKVGLRLICTSVWTRRTFLFILLAVKVGVLCVYFFYMMWNIYLKVFKPKSIL